VAITTVAIYHWPADRAYPAIERVRAEDDNQARDLAVQAFRNQNPDKRVLATAIG
jgi:hypothetical protein